MNNQLNLDNQAYMLGVIVGALIVGVLCGLIPLITGLKKNQKALGIAGFICCIIGGFILGLILALPIGLIFMAIINSKAKSQQNQFPPAGFPNQVPPMQQPYMPNNQQPIGQQPPLYNPQVQPNIQGSEQTYNPVENVTEVERITDDSNNN